MSRYSRVLRRMWGDEKFRNLSAPKPNARDLWIHLLTGEHCTSLPGLFVMGIASMAESMEWPYAATKKCFEEILAQGMARFDPATRVVWLPNAIRHNTPENFNVIVGWKAPLDAIPECQLRTEAVASLVVSLRGIDSERDPARPDCTFVHAFSIAQGHAPRKRSANPSGKGLPNPSVRALGDGMPKGRPTPDPDPEPEQEQDSPPEARGVEAIFEPDEPRMPSEQPGASAFNGLDEAMRLRELSGERCRTSCGPQSGVEFGRLMRTAMDLHKRRDLIELLGRYALNGDGFAWMEHGGPTMDSFLRKDGAFLFSSIEKALEWERSVAPKKPAAVASVTQIARPLGDTRTPEQRAAIAARAERTAAFLRGDRVE